MKPVLGILGGMGVMASAEFARTVYELNNPPIEQQAPVVILYSDPTFPDRTQAWLEGRQAAIAERLALRLAELRGLNVGRVVMGCVTLHYALPLVPAELRAGVVSLVDVALAQAGAAGGRLVLFCSNGARQSGVFTGHPAWAGLAGRVALPDDEDQALVHGLLYQYKTQSQEQPFMAHLPGLLRKYRAGAFIAGCTELHLLTKHIVARGLPFRFIDPLYHIARHLPDYL